MTQPNGLLVGIGLDAATRFGTQSADCRNSWSVLANRFDGEAAFLTLEDGFAQPGNDGFDAVLLANWLAPRLRHIAVIASAPVNFLEPFHISTAIATLDYVSEGKAGLLVQRLRGERAIEASRAIGALDGFPTADRDLCDRDALDAIAAIRALWDSWEDDAVIRDQQSQRFLDGEKLHYIDFEGAGFRILGPSITPRPPQGQPVVAIGLSEGDDLSILPYADVVFVRPDAEFIHDVRVWGQTAADGKAPVIIADIAVGGEVASPVFIEAAAAWGIDGIRLNLSDPVSQTDYVLNELLPTLRRTNLIRQSAAGDLRGRFGLPQARNRYGSAA